MNLNTILNSNLLMSDSPKAPWFFIGTIIFLLLSLIIITFTIFWKGKKIAMIEGFVLGIIGFGIFVTIRSSLSIDETEITNSKNMVSIIGNIFVDLVIISMPLYIFTTIVLLFIGNPSKEINKRTYIASFSSLLLMSTFGIFVALCMIPIILVIPDNLKNFDFGESESIGWIVFLKRYFVLIFIIIAIITGILLKQFGKTNNNFKEKSQVFFLKFNDVLLKYISAIVFIVPFIITSVILKFSLLEVGVANDLIKIISIYFGIYWLGSLIILSTLTLLNIFISPVEKTTKEKATLLMNHSLYVFGTQSTSVSLIKTKEVARELGVSEEVSNLTPTKGIIMGMVMCNGFTPTLIILMSLNNYHNLTFLYILGAIALVFILLISSSGGGSSDYTISVTVLSVLNINNLFYLNTIMPIQEINESLIAKSNNVLGHLLASQITERYNNKSNKIEK